MSWLFPIIASALFFLYSLTYASNLTVKICDEKNYNCQYLPLTDVKKVEKIADGKILRITFLYGGQLDISVDNKYYEIKK